MAVALKRYPRRIDHKRSARNGHVPQATFKGRLLHAQNHALAYRRKHFFSWGDIDNLHGGSAGTVTRFRFRCHTGHGATHITALLGLAPVDNSAAADPSVNLVVTEAGGSALPTESVHYGLGDGSPEGSPDEVTEFKLRVAVSANTTYEVEIQTVDYARIRDVCAYEEASPIIDTSVDFYVDEAVGSVGFPVFDSHREDHVRGMSEMWRRNGAHLYSYAGINSNSIATTTWTGFFDGTTAVAADSTKVVFNDVDNYAQMLRASDGQVLDVVFAVYAQAVGGNTGEVRLQDSGGTICSITGVTTTLQWHTTTTTISGFDVLAGVDLQRRVSNAAHSMTLYAVSLYAYLA